MRAEQFCRFVPAVAMFAAVIGAAPRDAHGQLPCVLTCPVDITTANDPNQCGAVVNYPAPTTSGTCGTVTCTPASGSFFPVGTTTVTCNEDAGATCSFTVTVTDTQPPSVTCPANITQSNDPNQCSAVVAYAPPTASDNCPGLITVCSPPSGSTFPVGSTMTTCTATDASLNTATCGFNVTVNDTEPPSITCPANITQSNDPGQCSAVVSYPPPTASDNCPGLITACSPPSGSTFPVGTTTTTCTATDPPGNTATCSATVTVNDVEVPTITCPPDRAVPADFNGTAAVDYPPPSTSDNCPVTTQCVPPSGSTLPIGETTATCTVTDPSANTATCAFLINVFRPVPTLGTAGLAALVLIMGTIGGWLLYRRRATG